MYSEGNTQFARSSAPQQHEFKKNKSFVVDTRIQVALDPELASALGELILSSNPENTALLALGHQLCKVFGDS